MCARKSEAILRTRIRAHWQYTGVYMRPIYITVQYIKIIETLPVYFQNIIIKVLYNFLVGHLLT